MKLAITLRVIGGVGGLVLGGLFDDATGLDTSAGAGFWIWIVLGWLLGASWAEYRLTRPPSAGQVGVADAAGRRRLPVGPRMYAAPVGGRRPSRWSLADRAGRGAGARQREPAGRRRRDPLPVAGLAVAGIGAVVIALLVRLAVRAVVARRQPTGPADIVAADDAIRASAVHHLAGGGTAAILSSPRRSPSPGCRPTSCPSASAAGSRPSSGSPRSSPGASTRYRHWRVRREPTRCSVAHR